MYASRFGISALPFQLTPDPDFYFDSRAHHDALAALGRGLAAPAGCIVISGEIGAGKTTVLRTLLAGVDPAQAAVAHVVSTQLDAEGLLGAALIGLGVRPPAGGAETLSTALAERLVALRHEGRRAILVVDEAHNLQHGAVQPLVALMTQAQADGLPFHLCLVGQPELRALLADAALEGLRVHVRETCHLGPIAAGETGPYIEHRLRKVGWNGTPRFEPGAVDIVFRVTGGIPRRINLLCNRLLLACFLSRDTTIDAARVARIASELRAELGEPPLEAELATLAEEPAVGAIAPVPAAPVAAPRGAEAGHAPLLCIAAGHGDHLRAAALMQALRLLRDVPRAQLVRVHDDDALALDRALYEGLEAERDAVVLDVDAGEDGDALLGGVFRHLFRLDRPRAVVLFDASPAAAACAAVAKSLGIAVVHVGAGVRGEAVQGEQDLGRRIDALADVLYTADPHASRVLAEEGIAPEQVHCAGNLLADAVRLARRAARGEAPGLARLATSYGAGLGRAGYGVVVLGRGDHLASATAMQSIMAVLADVCRDLFLVWPRHARAESMLRAGAWHAGLPPERCLLLPPQSYPDYVELLSEATCVLTDSSTVQEEATALGVPCLTLGLHPARAATVTSGSNTFVGTSRALATRAVWGCIFNGGKRRPPPPLWDGRAGRRIAGFVGAWLHGNASAVTAASEAA